MLRHLRATNFAILSDVEIELGVGMNVLTGETGAGKSLIVEAVNLLRGGRASADIPRTGTDEAVVEATVEVPDDLRARVAEVLEGAGLPSEGEEVFIRRVIQRGGRSRCYVNGALTTAARLAELGALLIDLSGQHQHQGLVDPGRHLEILDLFSGGAERSGEEAGPLGSVTRGDLAAMKAAWAELKRCDETVLALGGDEREREARLDYVRFQLEELDAANLQTGEDQAIEIERVRLASVDHLQGATRTAEELLYGGDDSARDRVAAAARDVERALRTDPTLDGVARQLGEIETLIDDAADQLRSYADRLEGDPERLAYLDERLALIRRLTRKHGGNLDEVIAKAAELRSELATLTGRDEKLAEAQAARNAAEQVALAAAAALTKTRTKAARKLEKDVNAALGDLGMGTAKLSVVIEPRIVGGGAQSSGSRIASSGETAGSRAASGGGSRIASSSETAGSRAASGGGQSSGSRIASSSETAGSRAANGGGQSSGSRIASSSEMAGSSAASGGGSRIASSSEMAGSRAANGGGQSSGSRIASGGEGAGSRAANGGAQSSGSRSANSGEGAVGSLGPTGADRVELMLAANQGEDRKPLTKVASGGELSRIMLALKLSLRRADEVATYVFDEVDTGIGGSTAQVVGAQIRAVASTGTDFGGRQVLCVTHLPQIAAYADHHFHVEKTEIAGRTETHVRKLTGTARKDELARMLGGQATSKAKAHAAELLAEAARDARAEAKKPRARA